MAINFFFQACQSISKGEGVDCKPLMLQLALSHVDFSGFQQCGRFEHFALSQRRCVNV